jgi:hypothetical protein
MIVFTDNRELAMKSEADHEETELDTLSWLRHHEFEHVMCKESIRVPRISTEHLYGPGE